VQRLQVRYRALPVRSRRADRRINAPPPPVGGPRAPPPLPPPGPRGAQAGSRGAGLDPGLGDPRRGRVVAGLPGAGRAVDWAVAECGGAAPICILCIGVHYILVYIGVAAAWRPVPPGAIGSGHAEPAPVIGPNSGFRAVLRLNRAGG
jgi:hypothetical protein